MPEKISAKPDSMSRMITNVMLLAPATDGCYQTWQHKVSKRQANTQSNPVNMSRHINLLLIKL